MLLLGRGVRFLGISSLLLSLLGAQPIGAQAAGGPECDNVETAAKRSGTLVVLVPGLESSIDDWTDLVKFLRNDEELRLQDAAFVCYDHRLGFFSTTQPVEIARDIAATTAAYWDVLAGRTKRPRVVMIAHSAGAIMVRAAHLMALGRLDGEVTAPHEWATSVERLVLLAGIGRGASPGRVTGAINSLIQAVPGVGSTTFAGQQFLRGAPFLTNVRLSTIAAFSADTDQKDVPAVVQLLGTEDKVVGESDNIDLLTLPTAVQIHVPRANHRDIIHVKWTENDDARRITFRRALAADPKRLRAEMKTSQVPTPTRDTTPIFVLLHGIRSGASSWPVQLEERLIEKGVEKARVLRPNYGYFTIANFLNGAKRERERSHFLDSFVAFRAAYPTQPVDIVAHSFGTHIVGNSISRVPSLRARRVLLVSSVLPARHNWAGVVERRQADSITSIGGTNDWVVGFASATASGFPRSTVGASAVEEFVGTTVHQCKWVPGNHSAPLDTSRLRPLAHVLATKGNLCEGAVSASPSGIWRTTARLGPKLGKVLFFGALWGAGAIVANGSDTRDRWRRAGYVVGGSTVVWNILDLY